MKINWMTASLLALSLNLFCPPLFAEVYDRIKVLVDDQVITEQEIKIRTDARMRGRVGYLLGTDVVGMETARAQVIKGLIEDALTLHRAEQLKIKVNPVDIGAELSRFKSRNRLSEVAMEDVLERQHTTLLEFKRTIRDKLARKQVLQREVNSQVAINESKLKAEYYAQTTLVQMVHARHLLLLVPKGASKTKQQQVLKKIREIRVLLVKGADFGATALKYSQDPTVKSNQGDLGFFQQKDMEAKFAQFAFSLPVGHLSEPIKTQFGYHLIEVLAKESRAVVPFAKVRDKLYKRAWGAEYQTVLTRYLANLRAGAKISYR